MITTINRTIKKITQIEYRNFSVQTRIPSIKFLGPRKNLPLKLQDNNSHSSNVNQEVFNESKLIYPTRVKINKKLF